MRETNYILDANAVLRYLLQDVEDQFEQVKVIIQKEKCVVPLEVISEVCYVLEGLYEVSRLDMVDVLRKLCIDVQIVNEEVFLHPLEIFDKTPKLDFVDCLLYGYKIATGADIVTFDQKLKKRLI